MPLIIYCSFFPFELTNFAKEVQSKYHALKALEVIFPLYSLCQQLGVR